MFLYYTIESFESKCLVIIIYSKHVIHNPYMIMPWYIYDKIMDNWNMIISMKRTRMISLWGPFIT